MANEITEQATVSVSKSGGGSLAGSGTYQADMTGNNVHSETYDVGTVEEEIDYGVDIGTPGGVMIKNLDATNYVQIGLTTGVYVIRLMKGQSCLFRPDSGTSLFVKANSATVRIQLWAWQA